MHIVVKCPGCDASLPVSSADAPATIVCGRCQQKLALTLSADVREDRGVDRCPVCAGADFYVRKDFNPKIGVGVVVIGAVISAIFYWLKRDLAAYGILAAAALLDLLIYGLLALVTVCYRCHAEFRGTYARTAAGFDLHVADLLEVEYRRTTGRR